MMTARERERLLEFPEVRTLLSFELAAHNRILATAAGVERRRAYAEVYADWPALIAQFNRVRGAQQEALGFNARFIEWFRPWLQGARVLEIGCGAGAATRQIARVAADVVGIDVSETSIRSAEVARTAGVQFRVADATSRLPFGEEFDVVYWNDVAEHLHPEDLQSALTEIRRVLRTGGVLCTVTCHADDGPHDASMMIVPTGASPLGVHMQEFTYASWSAELRAAGFRDVRAPVVGINLLRKVGLITYVDRFMRSRGAAAMCERSVLSRRSEVVRWATGADVICSVARVAP